jgi:hypothetical protein
MSIRKKSPAMQAAWRRDFSQLEGENKFISTQEIILFSQKRCQKVGFPGVFTVGGRRGATWQPPEMIHASTM